MYAWKIKSYAYLVKVGKWNLELVEGDSKPVVEESYREIVAIYLATGELPQ